jgi:tetratricopeptide (TPR) repeat protein
VAVEQCRLVSHFYTEFIKSTLFMLTDPRYYHQRGKSESHNSFAALAQEIAEAQPCWNDEIRRLFVAIHYCRGSEASQSNQPVLCLEQFEKLIKICREACEASGKPDEDLASAYNEVGVAYMMNKRYSEGKEHFLKSIEIYRGLDDYSTDMTAFPSANLGLAYWLLNQYDRAIEILQEALRDREETFGQNDSESLK